MGVDKRIVRWAENWLNSWAQQVVTIISNSFWRQGTSSAPHGLVLGPILFNIFINDPDDGTDCNLSNFADDTKLRGVTDTLGGCSATQRDLNRIEKQANRKLMKLNKGWTTHSTTDLVTFHSVQNYFISPTGRDRILRILSWVVLHWDPPMVISVFYRITYSKLFYFKFSKMHIFSWNQLS